MNFNTELKKKGFETIYLLLYMNWMFLVCLLIRSALAGLKHTLHVRAKSKLPPGKACWTATLKKKKQMSQATKLQKHTNDIAILSRKPRTVPLLI